MQLYCVDLIIYIPLKHAFYFINIFVKAGSEMSLKTSTMEKILPVKSYPYNQNSLCNNNVYQVILKYI